MAGSTDEFPVKGPDDVGDEISRLHQSWDDRLHFERPKLIERYLRGKLCLWVKLRVCSLNPREFYALFRKASETCVGRHSLTRRRHDGLSVPPLDAHLAHEGACANDQKQAVLVSNVQVMDGLENRGLRIPTTVGLYSPDEFNCGSGDALYFSATHLVFEFARLGANGEPMSIVDGVSPLLDQCGNKMIQAGTKTVDDLAGQNGKSGWKRNVLKSMPDICAAFDIALSDKAAWIRLAREKHLSFEFEILDLLFGPFNLCPASDPKIL